MIHKSKSEICSWCIFSICRFHLLILSVHVPVLCHIMVWNRYMRYIVIKWSVELPYTWAVLSWLVTMEKDRKVISMISSVLLKSWCVWTSVNNNYKEIKVSKRPNKINSTWKESYICTRCKLLIYPCKLGTIWQIILSHFYEIVIVLFHRNFLLLFSSRTYYSRSGATWISDSSFYFELFFFIYQYFIKKIYCSIFFIYG